MHLSLKDKQYNILSFLFALRYCKGLFQWIGIWAAKHLNVSEIHCLRCHNIGLIVFIYKRLVKFYFRFRSVHEKGPRVFFWVNIYLDPTEGENY